MGLLSTKPSRGKPPDGPICSEANEIGGDYASRSDADRNNHHGPQTTVGTWKVGCGPCDREIMRGGMSDWNQLAVTTVLALYV